MFGHGTTIEFASGFFAQILNINWQGIERQAVDVTDFSTTGGRDYDPVDLVDGGEVVIEVKHRLDAVPPIDQAPETFTINWPVSPPKAMSAQGFMTQYAIVVEEREFVRATATLKIKKGITWPT